MNRITPLFFLIILTLLFGVRSETQEIMNPKKTEPQRNKSELHQEESVQQKTPIAPLTAIINQSVYAQPNPPTTKTDAPQQKAQAQVPVDSDWWFNFFLVIFSGCLVVVGIAQVVVYRRQAQYMREGLALTKQAADAAKVSADAAKAALTKERPYLLITSIEPHNFDTKFTGHEEWIKNPYTANVTCRVRNFGKTPAIITEIIARMEPSSPPLPIPPDFSTCFRITAIARRIISESEETNFLVMLIGQQSIITDKLRDILQDDQSSVRIDLKGIIIYEDPTGEKFGITFGHLCAWVRDEDSPDFHWAFVRGPDEYFIHT